jgi:23S rRNA (uracil1939-C5)-methyltransferase
MFFQALGVHDFDIIVAQETRWRTRAKLAVRRQHGDGVAIGLFRRGTHEVLPIPQCLAHHPKINEAVAYLATLPAGLGYNEETGTGQLRYIQAVVERSSQRVQLTFVLNLPSLESAEVKAWEQRTTTLFANNSSLWHSFWLNLQSRPTNTIFGPTWKHVVGNRLVWETLADCQIPFLPSHFVQANLAMFDTLLRDLVSLLPRDAHVVELFAGMGVISLVIRPRCARVTAVERDGGALAAFLEAKEKLPLHLHEGMEFIVGDVAAGNEALGEATTVVVDPPRKGLPKSLVESIARAKNVRTLLYISCHFPTLERDIIELMQQGRFHIAFARSYLFFPGTEQVETLVNLVR